MVDVELYNAIDRAVKATIKEIGRDALLKTSFFASNRRKIYSEKLAA